MSETLDLLQGVAWLLVTTLVCYFFYWFALINRENYMNHRHEQSFYRRLVEKIAEEQGIDIKEELIHAEITERSIKETRKNKQFSDILKQKIEKEYLDL